MAAKDTVHVRFIKPGIVRDEKLKIIKEFKVGSCPKLSQDAARYWLNKGTAELFEPDKHLKAATEQFAAAKANEAAARKAVKDLEDGSAKTNPPKGAGATK